MIGNRKVGLLLATMLVASNMVGSASSCCRRPLAGIGSIQNGIATPAAMAPATLRIFHLGVSHHRTGHGKS